MLPISTVMIQHKNQLGDDDDSLTLWALKIVVPGLTDPIRVVRDDDNLTWLGETWVAFPFEIQELTDTSKSEIPQVVVKLANVSRAIEAYLQQWDTFIKNNGYYPITANIYVVNTTAIAIDQNCDPEAEYVLDLEQPVTDAQWATFTFSASSPMARRFPQNRMLKNHCRYIFKDIRCGYAGTVTTCDHTLINCRSLDNSSRFGGFPGVGQSGLTLASIT